MNINITNSIEEARTLLAQEKNISSALRVSIELILTLVTLIVKKKGLNSKNSSIPPSQDPNREKESKAKGKKKVGGQKGHNGTTLKAVEEPDEIKVIKVDKRKLPKGKYKVVGYDKRQVFDIDISTIVTEYQAEIVENEEGKRFTAPFPKDVNNKVQYGLGVKANAVYMSQYQLIPYNRVQEHFDEQMNLGISAGTIYNFNVEAYDKLALFEAWLINRIRKEPLLHADETGVNIGGKRNWLHCASNDKYTYFTVDEKRGQEAMDRAKVLPDFKGILVHDHWKPYYKYKEVTHALCNAHHIRELQRVVDHDKKEWAKKMIELLKEMNNNVHESPNSALSEAKTHEFREKYDDILEKAQKESPPPDESTRKAGQRGRLKRTKSRALLERLINFKDDVLRFLDNPLVPFTNNQGENDIRMTKVHQKISGSFRSTKGAEIFCRVRSYLSTCRKHNVSSSLALELLFKGELPLFVVGGTE
jgi:transposase